MGESKDDEKKKEGDQEKKKKAEEESSEIVLKVDMHCEACARKIARSLKGFQGVEEVATDSKAGKVVVKGKTADPIKVCERLQKKSGRKVEIISPLPKPPPTPEKKDEEAEKPKQDDDEAKKKDEQQQPPPSPITVVLNIMMHCEACAQALHKRIRKIQGVESVETDLANGKVTVKGIVEPTKLVDDVYKKTKKQASIVPEEKKEEEKKKDEEEDKKGEEKKEEDNKKTTTSTDHVKKNEYLPARHLFEYANAYPPQIFSDENPNACFIM